MNNLSEVHGFTIKRVGKLFWLVGTACKLTSEREAWLVAAEKETTVWNRNRGFGVVVGGEKREDGRLQLV